MKHALLITYYFPPSGGPGVQRMLKFARYLPEFGWKATVLTVDPRYAAFPATDTALLDQIPDSTHVVRTRAWDPYALYARLQGVDRSSVVGVGFASDAKPNLRRRLARWIRGNLFLPDARVGWYPFAIRQAKALMRSNVVDVVMTSGPPHTAHLVGKWLVKQRPAPWVVDMRDPWTDVYYTDELAQSGLARWLDRRMERQVLSRADAVLSVSDGMGAWLKDKASIRHYQTITNGFDPGDLPARRTEQAGTDTFIIAHYGTYSNLQHAPGLLRALTRLATRHRVELHFVGHVDSAVLHEYRQAGLGAVVKCHAYMPHAEALESMQDAHLLLVAVQRTEQEFGVLPIKTFEYLGVGKPILGIALPGGELATVLERTGGGKAFGHEDDTAIEAHIGMHLQCVAEGKDSPRPDFQATRAYERKELTRQLAGLFDSLQGKSTNSRDK